MKQLALLILAALLAGCAQQPQLGVAGSAHEHADFKVYVNGAAYDFSQERYMGAKGADGEDNCGNGTTLAHLHDMDGEVVHKHATGVTWGYFFSTLGMDLSDSCLVLDNGTSYCNWDGKSWEHFVNGGRVNSIKDLEINDLDRALLTYGASYEEVVQQDASVTHKALQEENSQFC